MRKLKIMQVLSLTFILSLCITFIPVFLIDLLFPLSSDNIRWLTIFTIFIFVSIIIIGLFFDYIPKLSELLPINLENINNLVECLEKRRDTKTIEKNSKIKNKEA